MSKVKILSHKKNPGDSFRNIEDGKVTTTFGKIDGTPLIYQWMGHSSPYTAFEAVERLRKAGVLVPNAQAIRSGVLYSRIGSKKRGFYNNTLGAFVFRYFDALLNGNKPPTGRLNSLLTSAARTLGKAHSVGVFHNHPHFNNFVVSKKRVGMIDFKDASVSNEFFKSRQIDWNNPKSIYENTWIDLKHLANTWGTISDYYAWTPLNQMHNPKWTLSKVREVQRNLERRKRRFFEIVIEQYPATPQVKEAFKKKLFEKFENLVNMGPAF